MHPGPPPGLVRNRAGGRRGDDLKEGGEVLKRIYGEADDVIRSSKLALVEKFLEAICEADLPLESVKEVFDAATGVLVAGKIYDHPTKKSALAKSETQEQKDVEGLYRRPDKNYLTRKDELQLKVMEAVCEAELPLMCVKEVFERVPDALIPTKIYGRKIEFPMHNGNPCARGDQNIP